MEFNCNSLFGYKIWARVPKLLEHLFGGVVCYRNGFFALGAKGWIHFLGVLVNGLDRRTNTWGKIAIPTPFSKVSLLYSSNHLSDNTLYTPLSLECTLAMQILGVFGSQVPFKKYKFPTILLQNTILQLKYEAKALSSLLGDMSAIRLHLLKQQYN